MPIFLAMLSSLTFGVADFGGGMAAKRSPAVSVVVGSQLIGLTLVLAIAPAFGAGGLLASELWWGASAGLAGAVGLVAFYHGLATGRMSVVAPLVALFATVTPVLFGVIDGERPELLAWFGIALVIPATILIGAGADAERRMAVLSIGAVALGVLAGVMFGLFGILISRTGEGSGLWPLVAARVSSISIVAIAAVGLRRPLLPKSWGWVAIAGGLDMTANILFLVAVRDELLSLVAVIMAFYPASTLILARVVVGERLVRLQALGIAVAAAGVVLIAVA